MSTPADELVPPDVGATWQHKKGTLYTVILVTEKSDAGREDEFPVTVSYVGPDGRVWPRTLPRWHAGMTFHSAPRFKPGSLMSRLYLGWLIWSRQRKAGKGTA